MKQLLGTLLLAAFTAAAQTSSPSFEQLTQKAQQAYEANQPEEAAQLYSRAVAMRPDWTEGWWALGMIAYEGNHYAKCRDALSHMVKLDATAAPGFALLGICEFETKQYDAAFENLKTAHVLVPLKEGSGPLLDMADLRLAMLLTQQGAFEVAQNVMLRVVHHTHSNPESLMAAGLMCLRVPILPSQVPEPQKDVVTMAGQVFWDLATRTPAEADAAFEALVSKYPKFPNVHYFYGTHLATQHPEKSRAEFLEELKIDPDNVPAMVQLTLRDIVEGKLDEALKFAREAVALSPDSVGAQLALAQTLQTQGNYKGALAAYLEAKRIDPVSPRISLYLANTYRALGEVDEMRAREAEYRKLKAEQQNWP